LSKVFSDTSSLYALLSATDKDHQRARRAFDRLRADKAVLITTSYVLVETYALVDRRLGRDASRRFHDEFAPLLEVIWVGPELHERAMDLFLASKHSVSLVDGVSFLCMRDLGLNRAWAIDHHFVDEGFEIVE
jgi:predicted nucleic acid-binding protein